MRRTATGIGGAYMIGMRVARAASASIGTTTMAGRTLVRGLMPFTSLRYATVMRCFLAMDSKLSPFFG